MNREPGLADTQPVPQVPDLATAPLQAPPREPLWRSLLDVVPSVLGIAVGVLAGIAGLVMSLGAILRDDGQTPTLQRVDAPAPTQTIATPETAGPTITEPPPWTTRTSTTVAGEVVSSGAASRPAPTTTAPPQPSTTASTPQTTTTTQEPTTTTTEPPQTTTTEAPTTTTTAEPTTTEAPTTTAPPTTVPDPTTTTERPTFGTTNDPDSR